MKIKLIIMLFSFRLLATAKKKGAKKEVKIKPKMSL
jgi:hypothetical protein